MSYKIYKPVIYNNFWKYNLNDRLTKSNHKSVIIIGKIITYPDLPMKYELNSNLSFKNIDNKYIKFDWIYNPGLGFVYFNKSNKETYSYIFYNEFNKKITGHQKYIVEDFSVYQKI